VKVFVQVPCLNEEATLPAVLDSIPKSIPGVDELHVLVIDDGSTDRTVEVAREHGVTHFVHHVRNQGLARSFRDGIHYALSQGADIVVNTDGDNQYPQAMIPAVRNRRGSGLRVPSWQEKTVASKNSARSRSSQHVEDHRGDLNHGVEPIRGAARGRRYRCQRVSAIGYRPHARRRNPTRPRAPCAFGWLEYTATSILTGEAMMPVPAAPS
jgi:glycosyltransferase involved in cell wall biosynthesis